MKPFVFKITSLCLLSLSALGGRAAADVQVNRMFGNHMVLQQEASVPVWGKAAAGETVTVTFRQQTKTATTDKDGNWMVRLNPLKVGEPGKLTVRGKNSVTFDDVLVGEVWVGSGQSNMAGRTGGYAKRDKVLAKMVSAAPYPNLRLYRGGWKESTAKEIAGFSALMFSFGLPLQQELKVPVGLIVGAVGGTPSGRWLSPEMLAADPACQAALKKAGKPRRPIRVGDLYARNIKPILPYAIRGVLWDQGESGTAVKGIDQFTMMGALIGGWRKAWGQGEFPFLYVQKLSGGGCAFNTTDDPVTRMADPFAKQPSTPNRGNGLYRELHIKIMQHKNTAMVTASDLGGNVHPLNKSGYGRRASRVALGFVYKHKVEIYGPIYASHEVEADKIRIRFKHVGQGIAFRHGDKLQGFEVSGKDGAWHWADAKIDGETVVVSSGKEAKPIHARYGWSRNHAWANLFNKDGLPALTFRTNK